MERKRRAAACQAETIPHHVSVVIRHLLVYARCAMSMYMTYPRGAEMQTGAGNSWLVVRMLIAILIGAAWWMLPRGFGFLVGHDGEDGEDGS